MPLLLAPLLALTPPVTGATTTKWATVIVGGRPVTRTFQVTRP